jgi:tRNA-Thr(GGU) m(6)t(6)A37 methyltransferase TsaA
MKIEPIGYVLSPVKDTVDEKWGQVVSEIQVKLELAPGLKGLNSFSHILVVYYMHEATWSPEKDLIRRPQGRTDMPELGIFSQRAKHRPNAIGITAVSLVEVKGNSLRVRGLDAIDGTPVLDIKPYFPVYDRIESPVEPEWVSRLMEKYF